jgi:replicative DNA helicase
MEAGLALGHEAADLADLRTALDKQGAPGQGLADRLSWCAGGGEAVEGLASYADRLQLVCAGGRRLDLDGVRELIHSAAPGPVVVDYLQKIAVPGDVPDEAERVTRVVEALKDLAMETARPVVAIVASDRAGIGGAVRTRLFHLRGSSALAYEADAALLLNNKFSIVSRNHLMYGGGDAERFREWVVCSIEKNRAGGAGVDLEFRTHLSRGHYDPHGGWVSESLVDDRVHTE